MSALLFVSAINVLYTREPNLLHGSQNIFEMCID